MLPRPLLFCIKELSGCFSGRRGPYTGSKFSKLTKFLWNNYKKATWPIHGFMAKAGRLWPRLIPFSFDAVGAEFVVEGFPVYVE